MENIDDKLIVAGISILASTVTTLIIKPIADKHLHRYKLESDYKAEQRRKIKDVLAMHKVHLLKSCEALNDRLWNFLSNHARNWHSVGGQYLNPDFYYIQSFVYRMLSVLAWIQIIEKELIYLDTTISDKKDLNMIKYFRLIEEVFCDIELFDKIEYTPDKSTDHFYRNKFEELSSCLIRDGRVITFSQFRDELDTMLPTIEQLFKFIEGMGPDEKRLRWHRLQTLHIVIISMLNSYGYDFQYTDSDKVRMIVKKVKYYPLLENFKAMVTRDRLSEERELSKVLTTITSNMVQP